MNINKKAIIIISGIVLAMLIGGMIGVFSATQYQKVKQAEKPQLICISKGNSSTLDSLTYEVVQGKKILAKEVFNYNTNTYNFVSDTYSQHGQLTSPRSNIDLIYGYYANLSTVNTKQ